MTDAQLKPCPFCESGNVKSGGDAPTDALAEHDAKVRADALREAVEIAIDERNKRGADKSTNGLWTAITRIQALIEGEA